MGIGLIVIASVAGSLALTPLVRHLAEKLGIVSRPDGARRLHDRPMPLWGGIGVCGGLVAGGALIAVLGPLLGFPMSTLPVWLLLSSGLVCLVGMIDDRHSLTAWGKLPGQIAAVLPIVLAGLSVERISCFGWELNLGWFAVPWAVGWLLLGINALNLLDGSDGLASTVGFVIALALAVVAAGQGIADAALLALVLAGALAGFVGYNLPPARIYLGDSGSTLIGFVLAALTLRVSCSAPGTASLPVMGLLLFVPLLDTGLAILRRLLKGQAICSGDRGHLHHQLQDRGFTAARIVVVLASLGGAAALAACLAIFWRQELLAVLAIGCVTGVLVYRQWIACQECSLLAELVFRRADSVDRPPSALPENAEQPFCGVWPIGLDERHVKAPHLTPSEQGDSRRRVA